MDKAYTTAKNNLTKALTNASDKQRADVLQFVVDWKIDPNEEFFLIFAAIGYLKVLIEDAPHSWQEFFQNLYKELHSWTNLTASQLKETADYSEVVYQLAQSSDRLAQALNCSDETMQQVLKQSQTLTKISTQLNSAEKNLDRTNSRVEELNRKISTNGNLTLELTASDIERIHWRIYGQKEPIPWIQLQQEVRKLAMGANETIASEITTQVWKMKNELEMQLMKFENRMNQLDLEFNQRIKCQPTLLEMLLGVKAASTYKIKAFSVFAAFLLCIYLIAGNLVNNIVETTVVKALEQTTVTLPINAIDNLQKAAEQAGYATVKLQRIEKKLGITK